MPSTTHPSPSTSSAAAETTFPNILGLATEQLRASGEAFIPMARSGWCTFKRALMTGVAFIAEKLGPIGAFLMSIIPQVKQVVGLVYDVACLKFQRFMEHRETYSTRTAPAGFAPPDPNAVPTRAPSVPPPSEQMWPDEVLAAEAAARRAAEAAARPAAEVTANAAMNGSASASATAALVLDALDASSGLSTERALGVASVLEVLPSAEGIEEALSSASSVPISASASEPPRLVVSDAPPAASLPLASSLASRPSNDTRVAAENASGLDLDPATEQGAPRRAPSASSANARSEAEAPASATSATGRIAAQEPPRAARAAVVDGAEGSSLAKRQRSLMRPLMSLVRVMDSNGSKLPH